MSEETAIISVCGAEWLSAVTETFASLRIFMFILSRDWRCEGEVFLGLHQALRY
jgi:hypothetical protein